MTRTDDSTGAIDWELLLGQLLFPVAVIGFILLLIGGLVMLELLFEFLQWTASTAEEGITNV